jgi:hypothetical protein
MTYSVRVLDSLNARPIPVNPWDARLMTLSKSRHYTVLVSESVWGGCSTQTFMPRVGFELTIPVFERAKTVHTLDREATAIGHKRFYVMHCLALISFLTNSVGPHVRNYCDRETLLYTVRGTYIFSPPDHEKSACLFPTRKYGCSSRHHPNGTTNFTQILHLRV